jgi:hypothetical protein
LGALVGLAERYGEPSRRVTRGDEERTRSTVAAASTSKHPEATVEETW